MVCCTLLIFTLLTRNRLCEVRLKDGYPHLTAMDFPIRLQPFIS
nr:Hok/Gef family protein [Escherichia coli]